MVLCNQDDLSSEEEKPSADDQDSEEEDLGSRRKFRKGRVLDLYSHEGTWTLFITELNGNRKILF